MDYPRVSADSRGVWREERPGVSSGIEWEEIHRIIGYKLDAVDETDIVLELEFEYGEFVELNDKFNGFADVVAAIGTRVPRLASDWFSRMVAASVEDDPVVLWARL